MCTSLTMETTGKEHFLARTMDFGFELDGKPIVIPRNYSWNSQLGGGHKTRYGFVGTGRKLEEYVLGDGLNEKGLAMAELYYLNEADYQRELSEDKKNLAPHEFIMWVLGEIASVSELRERIEEVALIHAEISLLGLTTPLHFIVTDKTGETIVIETNDKKLTVKENPVGVMANSPDFGWHLKNLSNYIALQPTNYPNKEFGSYTTIPFGQGSGSHGLPGGYTSPERFIRTVFSKQFVEQPTTSEEAVNTILHVLNGVTIPRGLNIKNDGNSDYTQYRSAMNTTSGIYYFNPYKNTEVFEIHLTADLLNKSEVTEFDYDVSFKTTKLN